MIITILAIIGSLAILAVLVFAVVIRWMYWKDPDMNNDLDGARAKRASEKLRVAALETACSKLLDYRQRAGAMNFALEKADDYLRQIEMAMPEV